jgi:serine/threonine protein kinase
MPSLNATINSSCYKAKRISDHLKVCIKIMEIRSEENKDQIENRIKILNQFDHPNVIKILDTFIDGQKICVVYEYPEQTLKDVLKIHLTQLQSLQIFVQILKAIEYVHSQNIVIRNLKPENIFFMKNGQLKIIGFEFSVAFTQHIMNEDATHGYNSMYSAPELYLQQENNTSCDIWSVGCILYQMLIRDLHCLTLNFEDVKINTLKLTIDLQHILFAIFSSDSFLRPSAKQILQSPFILQIPEDISYLKKPEEMDILNFPIEFVELFDFFSHLTLKDFLFYVSGNSSDKEEWEAFWPVCTNTKGKWLDGTNQFVQFYFQELQFELFEYRIQIYLKRWEFEISFNGIDWIKMHELDGNQTNQKQKFKVEHLESFSYIKLNFPGFQNRRGFYDFDICGRITNCSLTLLKLINSPKPSFNSQSMYSFPLEENGGFFSFLFSLEAKQAFDNFYLYSNDTSFHSSIFNLFKDDFLSWFSNEKSHSKIVIVFHNGIVFHPTSCKFKSGPDFFPQSLKISGRRYAEYVVLKEMENETIFDSPFTERIIEIVSHEYLNELVFEQTGLNSKENHIFCLSYLELYGELKQLQ